MVSSRFSKQAQPIEFVTLSHPSLFQSRSIAITSQSNSYEISIQFPFTIRFLWNPIQFPCSIRFLWNPIQFPRISHEFPSSSRHHIDPVQALTGSRRFLRSMLLAALGPLGDTAVREPMGPHGTPWDPRDPRIGCSPMSTQTWMIEFVSVTYSHISLTLSCRWNYWNVWWTYQRWDVLWCLSIHGSTCNRGLLWFQRLSDNHTVVPTPSGLYKTQVLLNSGAPVLLYKTRSSSLFDTFWG